MRSRLLLAAGAAAAAIVIGGCGGGGGGGSSAAPSKTAEVSPAGDIPDNQAYVVYAPPGAVFSLKVPEGWARTSSNGVTSFTDKLNRIEMQQATGSAAKRLASKAGKVTVVKRAAGTAKRITYLSRSAADPVTGKSRLDAVERYVFTHGPKTIVLTLSGPKGADNVDPWRIVTDSLRYTR